MYALYVYCFYKNFTTTIDKFSKLTILKLFLVNLSCIYDANKVFESFSLILSSCVSDFFQYIVIHFICQIQQRLFFLKGRLNKTDITEIVQT